MTNTQLYLAIGLPILFNTLVSVLLFTSLSQRITDINLRMSNGFAALNQRFDDMRDLWRAELRRVEEILDARLKHLEDRS